MKAATGEVMRRSALLLLGIAGFATALQASPSAGTRILNQAAISYTDALGQDRVTTTNEVALVVQRVYAATLEGDNAAFAPPGGDAIFHHQLRNTGNGSDLYCVSVAQDPGFVNLFTSLEVVLDRNGDGVKDTGDSVLADAATGGVGLVELDMDERASLMVIGYTAAGLTDGDQLGAILTVEAQEETGACVANSVTDAGANADGLDGTNEDVATITDDAILRAFKTSTYNANGAGFADDTITYTVTVENYGQNPATDVVLSDIIPAGTSYLAASATVVSGSFDTAPTESGGTVSGGILSLASGASAAFSFTVELDDTLISGAEIENTATAVGNLDGVAGLEPSVDSNTVIDLVAPDRGVLLSDTGADADAALNDGGDDDGFVDDTQTVAAIQQGEQALFDLTLTNTGNADDLMEIRVDPGSFPLGTAFAVLHGDGATPLLDADADGWVEIGPLAPNDSKPLVIVATLPNGATAAPYSAIVTARTDAEETITDAATLLLQDVTVSALDIAVNNGAEFNDNAVANQDPATAAAVTLAGQPGAVLTQPLILANEGGAAETYALSVWGDMGATTPLPAGWTISLAPGGIEGATAVGPVESATFEGFDAYISVPIDAAPGTYSLYVKADGPVSGATDIVRLDVTVGDVVTGLSLTPDSSGVIAPCSAKFYDHVLKNGGFVAENIRVAISSQTLLVGNILLPETVSADEAAGFRPDSGLAPGAAVAIYDASAGAWTTVALVTDGGGGVAIPLDPGDWTTIQARVSAGCDVPERAMDQMVITAVSLTSGETASVTDVTTVAQSYLRIEKAGAVDAFCDGSPDGAFQTGGLAAAPTECILWRLTVYNDGVEPVCDVSVSDGAPVFTALSTAPVIVSEPAPGAGSCTTNDPDINCLVGNSIDITGDAVPESHCLRAGETAEVRFGVRIE